MREGEEGGEEEGRGKVVRGNACTHLFKSVTYLWMLSNAL